MVDEKITELAVITALEDTDLFPMVDDVPGTPITKAIAHSDLVAESVDQILAALVGKKTVYIPASAMIPSVTGGCGVLVTTETAVNKPDISALPFADGSASHARFSFSFPKSWNLGTISYQAYWTGLVAGAGGVRWGLQAVAVSDDDTITVSYGTIIKVTDTFLAIDDQHIAVESAALTIGGTPAQGDMIYFDVQRSPADGADTRAAPADLLGIKLFYTVDTFKDD
ncbi:hypothetical protein LCGC14_0607580 [marine sediment metagenome]|uniref:Uncharacterized protein n=1 Tax=marine sediment metagenome TaxID=412755 RepID=A0A0F9TUV8_9ZZZZ